MATPTAVVDGTGSGVAVGSGSGVFGIGMAVGGFAGVSASAVAVLSRGSRATLPEQATNSRHNATALAPEIFLIVLLLTRDKSIVTGLIDELWCPDDDVLT